MSTSLLPRSVCAYCRLRSLIAAKRLARAKVPAATCAVKGTALFYTRTFTSTVRRRDGGPSVSRDANGLLFQLRELDHAAEAFNLSKSTWAATSPTDQDLSPEDQDTLQADAEEYVSPEETVRRARLAFGDVLPEGILDPEELTIYERLYGTPNFTSDAEYEEIVDDETAEYGGALGDQNEEGLALFRETEDGTLEELEYAPDEEQFEDEDAISSDGGSKEQVLQQRHLLRLEKTKRGRFFMMATKAELDAAIVDPNLSMADAASMVEADAEWDSLDEAGRTMYLDDVRYLKLERQSQQQDKQDDADELLQMLYIRYRAQRLAELEDNMEEQGDSSLTVLEDPADEAEEVQTRDHHRAHPLTIENLFATSPATLQLPRSKLVDPVSTMLAGSSPKHLSETAHKIFGGKGLPYSTSNPSFAKSMQQKPIPLDASQTKMSDIEADAFFSTIVPGVYASVTSAVVETRKRLGSSWLESLMSQDGGPRILDAGGAGAGIVAVREVLRAEWERMHDQSDDPSFPTGIMMPGGQTGGAPLDPPIGKATVLTANEPLRQRAAALLENTTFVPRLPDYVNASDSQARERGKFDIIIAPHCLWPLKEDYLRRQQVANLWSLLSAQGGVMVLLEKGVPRGFEIIAGARDYLLKRRIASVGSEQKAADIEEDGDSGLEGFTDKEKGMIIAPCTNHSSCPMYLKTGVSKGRKDYCHFEQRYIRPPFLQRVLGARDRNHEDVLFSYISVMRGRDLRDGENGQRILQGDQATDRAFIGYEHEPDPRMVADADFDPTAPAVPDVEEVYDRTRNSGPHSLSLPRTVLPPLKRTGHIILDLCTPSGTLERWTVPKSFSKQAFRDARKSSWGDLWALGAKTRIKRNVRLGLGKEELGGVDNPRAVTFRNKAAQQRAAKGKKGQTTAVDDVNAAYERSHGLVKEGYVKAPTSGRARQGTIKGIRDKRDKKGDGRGRRKNIERELSYG